MREILFQGKRIATGNWVEGSLLNYGDGDYDICSESGFPGELNKYAVYPETIGQFTGRADKNGKKVFEHDILQTFTVWADGTVEKCGVGVVQWWENDQCYVLATKEGYHIDDFGNLGRPEYYEVIGNIHDNPELLEVSNGKYGFVKP